MLETAIRAPQKLFAATTVEYSAANLLEPPSAWHRTFDFVFEANTLQVLPSGLRPRAIENIAGFLRPGGLLLVIARSPHPSDPQCHMPSTLTRAALSAFTTTGIQS